VPYDYIEPATTVETHRETIPVYTMPDTKTQVAGYALNTAGIVGGLASVPGSSILTEMGDQLRAPYASNRTVTIYDGRMTEFVPHHGYVDYIEPVHEEDRYADDLYTYTD